MHNALHVHSSTCVCVYLYNVYKLKHTLITFVLFIRSRARAHERNVYTSLDVETYDVVASVAAAAAAAVSAA